MRFCSYNVEWFTKLFNRDNTLSTAADNRPRLDAIRDVLQKVNADVVGVLEAPDSSGTGASTFTRLKNFAAWGGLRTTEVLTGFPAAGQQELAILYDPAKAGLRHAPGGSPLETNPRFDGKFLYDTDDDNVREQYTFERPPLEAEVRVLDTNAVLRLLLVHPKSKGIFGAAERRGWEAEARGSTRKLYAECAWIRRRVEEWLDDRLDVVVMGDVNDGPGMDYYEMEFGRSAVELIMGDLFEPDRALRHFTGRPKWTDKGWKPSSTRFKDQFTGTQVRALIDHILFSRGLTPLENGGKVWNPDEDADAAGIAGALKKASDHYPVSLDLLV